MKKFILLFVILIGLSGVGHTEGGAWDLSSLNNLINDIKQTLNEPGQPNEKLEGSFWEMLMKKLEKIAIALGNTAGVLFGDVKKAVCEVGHNFGLLKESDDASVSLDPTNNSASLHVYKKLPDSISNELSLPNKWEVYEVNVKNVPSVFFKRAPAAEQRP